MFNTPHLIKLARNNLLNNHYVFGDKKTSWKHIKTLYEDDCQFSTRAAPKLTDARIKPTGFQKMKVKLATQVLSSTVAASLNLFIRFNVVPAAAYRISEVIQMFDIFNSSSPNASKNYNRAFKKLDYPQDFLKKCDKFFAATRVLNKRGKDVTANVKCLRGGRITINCLNLVWEKLKKGGFEYLFTKIA